ncbi:MAG: peptidylprolyl isomerase [Rickettsiales bacterium]|nr:peptidylprolyl isomerase [Rickettsiales bacterium]
MRKDEKRILKISIFIVLLIEIILVCFFSYLHYRKYHFVSKGDLIANINGTNVYKMDIESRLKSFLGNETNLSLNEVDEEVFKAMVLEKYSSDIILKLAKKKGMLNNQYYKFIAKEYFYRLIREEYLDKYVFGVITEQDIRRRYEELVSIAENKEERKISHILVETEDEARRIRNNIVRMNNFENMAKRRSKDTISALNGGSLGYLVKEEITIKEFADIVFLLKLGELSRPIKTEHGWHIVRIDDIRNMKIKTYEESKNEIYEELRHRVFEEFISTILKKDDTNNVNILIELDNKKKLSDLNNTSNNIEDDNISNEVIDGLIENLDGKSE